MNSRRSPITLVVALALALSGGPTLAAMGGMHGGGGGRPGGGFGGRGFGGQHYAPRSYGGPRFYGPHFNHGGVRINPYPFVPYYGYHPYPPDVWVDGYCNPYSPYYDPAYC